jgi:hypothetical protein
MTRHPIPAGPVPLPAAAPGELRLPGRIIRIAGAAARAAAILLFLAGVLAVAIAIGG